VIRTALAHASLALALVGQAVSARAAEPASQWTDSQFEFALNGTELIRSVVRPIVFDDAIVQRELRRAGIAGACAPVRDAIDTTLAAHEAEYREWALPTLRKIVTPAEMAGPAGSIAPSGYHEQLGRRLLQRLRRERPQLLLAVEGEALVASRATLAALPAAAGDWRGRFADWTFDRLPGLTHRIACTVENGSNPDQAKLAFDGFYKISED
jgi:hypothetical protein